MKRKVFDQGGAADVRPLRLCAEVRRNIQSGLGVASLFDVQAAFISAAIALDTLARPGDLILAAPTGSGKTIAYAVPVIERLMGRQAKRLRAVVLVPTRDLAHQVAAVFTTLVEGTALEVGLLTGGTGLVDHAGLQVDIAVATPGRLVELVSDGSVSLEHLCYLVVDESDRLLKSAFNDWTDLLLHKMGPGCPPEPTNASDSMTNYGTESPFVRKIIASATQTRSPKHLAALGLFSPTVFICGSGDAGEIDVDDPDIDDAPRYSTPETLAETTLICKEVEQKPILLASLLGILPFEIQHHVDNWPPMAHSRSKIVFAKSVEAAHRLARLLEIVVRVRRRGTSDPTTTRVVEYTAAVRAEQRQKILSELKGPTSDGTHETNTQDKLIVVCSDVMARGMDLPDVDAVISYDVPADIKTYLHRVGRTARGGQKGYTVSLVLEDQARHFKMMQKNSLHAQGKTIKKEFNSSKAQNWEQGTEWLQRGLHSLKSILDQERLGLLNPDGPLADYALRGVIPGSDASGSGGAAWIEDETLGLSQKEDGRTLLRLQLLRNINQVSTSKATAV